MEAKLKHLEFIQGAIGRMASNSFLFKGWTITIASGLSAFGAADAKTALLIIAVASTVLFWGLDGYYLWLERSFVQLHKEVALKNEEDVDFSMEIDKTNAFCRWMRTCGRPHLWMFYGGIIAANVIGIFVTKGK